jgi:CHAD domain-containing protein
MDLSKFVTFSWGTLLSSKSAHTCKMERVVRDLDVFLQHLNGVSTHELLVEKADALTSSLAATFATTPSETNRELLVHLQSWVNRTRTKWHSP